MKLLYAHFLDDELKQYQRTSKFNREKRLDTLKAINDNNVSCPFLVDDCIIYDYCSCILEA